MANGKEPDSTNGTQVAVADKGEVLPAELRAQLTQDFDRLNLPEKARSELTKTVRTVVLQAEKSHSGPLPAADDFASYGHTLSTAPERIMVMAEARVGMAKTQQTHDHKIETWTLVSETIYRLVGLLIGGLLVAGMIGGSAYCAYIGATAAAVALGAGGAITGVGGIFVRGRDIAGLRNSAPSPQAAPGAPASDSAKGSRGSASTGSRKANRR